MATVNFSVPDDVKDAFNQTFRGQNKSAIIADLMRGAVAEARVRHSRRNAVQGILELRRTIEPLDDDALRALREEGRP